MVSGIVIPFVGIGGASIPRPLMSMLVPSYVQSTHGGGGGGFFLAALAFFLAAFYSFLMSFLDFGAWGIEDVLPDPS